jgi:hypothetical protein
MNKYDDIYKDLPQLIVALDSINDGANYIHIKDAKEGIIYYCPCCKGIVKPRAYKDDKDYQVQPHFYHENGGCNEETFIHYICKTWLFETGCKFKIRNQVYIVEKIETEKTYHTDFGDYRPDVTVYTTNGKVFYFEIKYTNKKTEHYIPRWDYLCKDVVEIDVRYFINQKIENDLPEFNLIYSDGECFIKSYTKKDYDEIIAKRKLEWKRQDKLNYKIIWERLDWFWVEIQKYRTDNVNEEDLLSSFNSLDFYYIEDCWNIVNKLSCCKNIKDKFRNIINNKSIEKSKVFLSEIKNKFNGQIENVTLRCEPRKDLCLSFSLTEQNVLYTYSYNKSDYIVCENKTWTILPSKLLLLFENFKEKEVLIINHCKNVDKIKNYFTWNKAPMLYDSYVFGSYIETNSIYSKSRDLYIKDSEKIINTINYQIINEVTKFYVNNFCINKSDIEKYINNYVCENKTIYNLLDKFTNYNEYGFNYKGNKVIAFKISNEQITYKDKEYNYVFVGKKLVEEFLKECIENAIEEFYSSITVIDMISDIKRYSNETWEFNLNMDEKTVKITLKYIIPYYDKYKKKIYADRYVDISEMFDQNFNFINYHEEVWLFLNNRIAPAMDALIEEEITKYNSSNITSALCRLSEVKTYDQ